MSINIIDKKFNKRKKKKRNEMDLEDYIKKNQVNEAPIETDRNEEFGFTTVSDDYYFFGFHDKYDGKLVRVSINAPNFEPTLKRWFGEPESEDSV